MGLTANSTGSSVLSELSENTDCTAIIALAGSPNVGKSTVFNALTGLKQHTGNWTGKTVTTAAGTVTNGDNSYLLVDVPGTYSLCARSAEETVARDFICFGGCDGVIAVCDALCLERNLALVLQIAEYTPRLTVCVNLIDQADKKGVRYDWETLGKSLGLAVVPCTAKRKKGLRELVEQTEKTLSEPPHSPYRVHYGDVCERALALLEPTLEPVLEGKLPARFTAIKMLCGDAELVAKAEAYSGIAFGGNPQVNAALEQARELLAAEDITERDFNDKIAEGLAAAAAAICNVARLADAPAYSKAEQRADKIITGRITAFPVMLLLLAGIFWLTVTGANYPSALLSRVLFAAEEPLYGFLLRIGLPQALGEMLAYGVYRVLAWVISVMLPPMAIFFPLFTLLEDVGFLPRIAYNLDRCFSACSACGKQALTMW